MNELLFQKREQFRIEIRRKQLEDQFRKNRIDSNHPLYIDNTKYKSVEEYEQLHKDQIENQLLKFIDGGEIGKLNEVIAILSSSFYIFLIEQDLFEKLETFEFDNEVSLQFLYTLFSEPKVIEYVFIHQKCQFISCLNYISSNLLQSHRELFWKVLLLFAKCSYTPFSFIKQIFYIFCEELISQKNENDQYQISIFLTLIQKYPQANQFFWEQLIKEDVERRQPWKAALHYLKQPNSGIYYCDQLILAICYLIQSSGPFTYHQIITPDLLEAIRNNLQRHQKTALRSLQCLQFIFEKTVSYSGLLFDNLINIFQNAVQDMKIEALKCIQILFQDKKICLQLIKEYQLIEIIFEQLENNKDTNFYYFIILMLDCLSYAFINYSNIDLVHLRGNYRIRNLIEWFTTHQDQKIQLQSEFILNNYFD